VYTDKRRWITDESIGLSLLPVVTFSCETVRCNVVQGNPFTACCDKEGHFIWWPHHIKWAATSEGVLWPIYKYNECSCSADRQSSLASTRSYISYTIWWGTSGCLEIKFFCWTTVVRFLAMARNFFLFATASRPALTPPPPNLLSDGYWGSFRPGGR
jgi:hypothetical protein